jgi:trk/ktr system potassium uptake protein
VLVLPAPRSWIGRSLRSIDCRARYGVAVLAVQHDAGDPAYAMPDPDRPLAAGDRLVVAGSAAALTKVHAA